MTASGGSDAGSPERGPRSAGRFLFRTIGTILIAAVAVTFPEVGANRFWLAAVLCGVCVPGMIWLERRYPMAENGWSEPLFDLAAVVTLVHLVPDMWFVALVIGLMVVQAPSVAQHETSYRVYAGFAALLTVGMTFAALAHGVPDWEIPVLCMTLLYPSVIWYSHQQAMRANEIQRRARAVEGLHLVAGGVAHDFNNMLTTVLGHAEIAQRELDETHPARESVDEVVEATHRAGLLAARLLSFSGRSPANAELLDVDSELRDLVALMQPVVAKGVQLELDADARGAHVLAERTQLQQVLMNLILNASEATETRPGTVFILTRRVRSGGGRDEIAIQVRDRGVGIPRALQDRVFDPFFSMKERGHGLGLASTRRITDELGGAIELASEVGRGTEVCITLPAEAAPPAEPADAPPRARVRGGTALVVDDEAAVRSVVGRMLGRLDYRVVEASSGAEAIAWIEAHPSDADLVLLDLRMPGMDGWSCLHELRRVRHDLPVVVCSGYEPEAVGERIDAPGIAVLSKPFRLDRLEDTLQELLGAPPALPH